MYHYKKRWHRFFFLHFLPYFLKNISTRNPPIVCCLFSQEGQVHRVKICTLWSGLLEKAILATSTVCTLGYSDFHNLVGFTSKKMPNNFSKMFVKKVFQLIMPFLANLHSTISQTNVCTQNDLNFF
jgi:hypothetical protein